MPYPDTDARTDQILVVQRAKRGRQLKRRRRIVTVAVLTVALLTVAARAWAHTIDLAVQEVCIDGKTHLDVTVNSQRGDYRFAGTATDGEGHSAAVLLPAGGGPTTVRLGPVTSSGSVRVVGDFWEAKEQQAEHMDRSARYRLLEDCKPPPTTTTNPPTTNPPTTSPPVPPQEEAPPTVTETPGELPFTGPEHPFGMNDLQWAAFLVGLGLFAGAAGLLWLSNRRQVLAVDERRLVARASARAMAAEARDGRDPKVLADMVARGRWVRDRLSGR